MGPLSILFVITSPVRFFKARLERPPNWPVAAAPVLAQCALAAAIGVVVSSKGQTAMTAALAGLREDAGGAGSLAAAVSGMSVLFSVLGTMFFFALSAGTVVVLDVLLAQSGRVRRLVEFTAYSYLPTVAWSIITLAVLVFWWTPPELRASSLNDIGQLQSALATHNAKVASTPLQLALRIVASYFWAWQIAIQAAALRVVSGFSVAGAWAAGVALIGLFVILPWVLAV